jgi:hypothetical protein
LGVRGWGLVKTTNPHPPTRIPVFGGDVGGSESHRYSEGFGAGLLVKLTLPLTR